MPESIGRDNRNYQRSVRFWESLIPKSKEFQPRMNTNFHESLFILMIHLFQPQIAIRENSCSFVAEILSLEIHSSPSRTSLACASL